MLETDSEISALQALLDRSYTAAGEHHREIMTGERRLGARQVVRHLDGIRHVAVATVNRRGEPRVSPLDSLFLHGRFHASTSGSALKAGHLSANTAVSVVYYVGDEVAVTVNGHAVLLRQGDAGTDDYDRVATELYGSSPFSWGSDIVVMRAEPVRMYAYAPHPEQFPE